VLAACGGDDEHASTSTTGAGATATSSPSRAATPACADADETPSETEGPFFSTGSPERQSLMEAGVTGTALTLTGTVLTTGCAPLANAKLDFWQADDGGEYDNVGFRLRGHQFTDANGGYQLETIVPGLYPGRTRHIHVKVQPEGGSVLTTQLFFPWESQNDSDSIYDAALLIDNAKDSGTGTFDFALGT
jgi:protocatechuate 3,4-dioxygenase beta subunit